MEARGDASVVRTRVHTPGTHMKAEWMRQLPIIPAGGRDGGSLGKVAS